MYMRDWEPALLPETLLILNPETSAGLHLQVRREVNSQLFSVFAKDGDTVRNVFERCAFWTGAWVDQLSLFYGPDRRLLDPDQLIS